LTQDEGTVLVTEPTIVTTEDQQPDVVVVTEESAISVIAVEVPDAVVAVVSEDAAVAIEQEPDIVVVSVGEQGPPGRDGMNGSGGLEYAFAYGDATPAVIVTAPAGKIIYGVEVHIVEPFNGVGASIIVGDAGDPDRLMAAHENEPSLVGANETNPAYKYATDTPVRLTINPGAGASQGSGLLTLNIQQ
jgi:hypothetical protein